VRPGIWSDVQPSGRWERERRRGNFTSLARNREWGASKTNGSGEGERRKEEEADFLNPRSFVRHPLRAGKKEAAK